jgi:DNA-binding CsgD family transcriptional regulator/PAS domain-containing protein
MLPTEADLLRLTVTVHEAAGDPSVWPQFLEDCARALRGDIMLLQKHHFADPRSEVLAAFGLTQTFASSYNDHYSTVNIWREHATRRRLYVRGRVFRDEECCPRSVLQRSEFYDHLHRIRGERCLTGVIGCLANEALTLTALRDERRQSWDADNEKTIAFLLPHVIRAQETQQRLQMLEAGEAALNTILLGIAMMGADGCVVFCNRAADEILRARDGLSLRHGQIAVSNSEVDGALQILVRYAVSAGEPVDCPPGVLVPRPSIRRPYHVTAAPLRRNLRTFIGMATPVAMVLITDPERRRPVASDTLKRMYGLTPKEAALAITLGEGLTLGQAAARLEMQYETARTHLRRILSKTQTSRQTDLVLLLERLSPHTLGI